MESKDMRVRTLTLLFCCVLIGAVTSCSSGRKAAEQKEDSASERDEFHADNDIAMIVRSAADAISYGEPLDTLNYNFDGVLTDGQGRPIYTNLHGVPGRWDIDAVTDTTLTIRNVESGDLVPDDLESYIVSSFDAGTTRHVESHSELSEEGHTTSVYECMGGMLRFDVHDVKTPSGETAAMMTISIER